MGVYKTIKKDLFTLLFIILSIYFYGDIIKTQSMEDYYITYVPKEKAAEKVLDEDTTMSGSKDWYYLLVMGIGVAVLAYFFFSGPSDPTGGGTIPNNGILGKIPIGLNEQAKAIISIGLRTKNPMGIPFILIKDIIEQILILGTEEEEGAKEWKKFIKKLI